MIANAFNRPVAFIRCPTLVTIVPRVNEGVYSKISVNQIESIGNDFAEATPENFPVDQAVF